MIELCDTGDELLTVTFCQKSDECQARNASVEVPNLLKDLLDRSCKYLGSDKRGEVAALLTECGDVFSASNDDLG